MIPQPTMSRPASMVLAFTCATAIPDARAATAQTQSEPESWFGPSCAELTGLRTPTGADIDAEGRIFIAERSGHRVSVWSSSGEMLARWGSRGRRPGEMERPSDVAVGPEGLVYVADTGNHRVQVFTGDGQLRQWWGEGGIEPGSLLAPQAIAVDERFVCVADTGNGRVLLFDHEGTLQRALLTGLHHDDALLRPMGVASDGADRIFVTDAARDFAHAFNLTRGSRHWGAWGGFPGLFAAPGGIDFCAGRLYVADTRNCRVQVFDAEGEFLYQWGERFRRPGDDRMRYPRDVAVAPDGAIAVVVEPLENRVTVFTAVNQHPRAPWSAAGSHFGVAAAVDGDLVAVHDEEHETIAIYQRDADGLQRVTDLGGRGQETGRLMDPGGMVVDARGRTIHVADTANGRIQQFRLEPSRLDGYDPLRTVFVRSWDLRQRLAGAAGQVLLWPPRPLDLARAPDGRWYVIDRENARILVFDERWRPLGQWPGFGEPTAIAIGGPQPLIHVLDVGRRSIDRFDLTGAPAGTIDGQQTLQDPIDLAVLPEGDILVTEGSPGRLVRLDRTGQPRLWLVEPSLQTGGAVATDGDGTILAIDRARQVGMLLGADGTEVLRFEPGDGLPDPADPNPAGPSADGGAPWQETLSNAGAYLVRWRAEPVPIPVNQPFTVHVEVRDGRDPDRLVARPLFQVEAAMPHHRHGLPQPPRTRRRGPGVFETEDLLFHMPGRWEIYFDVTEEGVTERAQTAIMVE